MKSYLYALIAAIIWGLSSTFSKIVLNSLDIWQFVFLSFSIVTIFLFLLNIVVYKNYSTIKSLFIEHFYKHLLFGFVIFIYYCLLYLAIDIGPTAESYIVNFLWGIFILPFSFLLLKEKIRTQNYLAIIVSFIGVIIIVTRFNISKDISIAYIYAFLCAILYALYNVLNKKWKFERKASVFLTFFIGTIFSGITLIAFSYFKLPETTTEILSAVFVGVFPLGFALILWLKALSTGNTSKIVNLLYLVPFFNILFVSLILKESIHYPSAILGTVLIVLGIIWQQKISHKV